jgi:predicted  nucleic acid-binding Zn-ribbon protein
LETSEVPKKEPVLSPDESEIIKNLENILRETTKMNKQIVVELETSFGSIKEENRKLKSKILEMEETGKTLKHEHGVALQQTRDEFSEKESTNEKLRTEKWGEIMKEKLAEIEKLKKETLQNDEKHKLLRNHYEQCKFKERACQNSFELVNGQLEVSNRKIDELKKAVPKTLLQKIYGSP